MASTDADSDGPTRRDYLQYGGAIVGGGLLAGCTGGSDSTGSSGSGSSGSNTASGSGAATETRAAATTSDSSEATESTGTAGGTSGAGSYSVAMSPMGEVTFEAVPETVFTRLTHLAGMAFALGRGNAVNAMHAPEYYDGVWNQFTPRLPGVSLDWSGLYSSWEPDKETLYELDSDVHLTDPASLISLENWTTSDVREVRENIAPWFGNELSDTHQPPPDQYSQYQYYSLWEMFEKVAAAFKANDQYRALAAVHSTLIDTIEEGLPPENDRPTVAMLGASDLDSIYAYKVSVPGILTAHLRPLGAVEAFDDDVTTSDTVDLETLLAADPDVILAQGGMAPGTSMADIRTGFENDSVSAQLSAVQNDRIYAQGARYQGPILNLFQLEMSAKQLYPDQFGEWPTYEQGPYPELPEGERLFDYDRVAAVINGDV